MSVKDGATWIELTIREGKNRQVRRMGMAIGHAVMKLRRTRVGPIDLGELPVGECRALTPAEVRSIRAIGTASSPRKKKSHNERKN